MTASCAATEPRENEEAATTASSGQDGGEVVGTAPLGNTSEASNTGDGQASGSHAPDVATVLTNGVAASPNDSGVRVVSVRNDAGIASNSSDAGAAGPDWAGLVTLDASITTGPDGAVIDGGVPHYDPDAAGPILNSQAQAACLKLADNICNRSADCQIGALQAPSSRRDHLVESCLDTLLLDHNCNRATRTTSTFNACAESVKTRDCTMVFASDFATACIDQITFQP